MLMLKVNEQVVSSNVFLSNFHEETISELGTKIGNRIISDLNSIAHKSRVRNQYPKIDKSKKIVPDKFNSENQVINDTILVFVNASINDVFNEVYDEIDENNATGQIKYIQLCSEMEEIEEYEIQKQKQIHVENEFKRSISNLRDKQDNIFITSSEHSCINRLIIQKLDYFKSTYNYELI